MQTSAMVWVVAAILLLGGCGVCGEDKLSETNSPGNKYVATVFRRGCGATTGFLYHVNIRSSESSFSTDYRGAVEEGQIFLTREGKITTTWMNDNTLQVTCNGCPKDRKPMMESSWKDVSVSYEFR